MGIQLNTDIIYAHVMMLVLTSEVFSSSTVDSECRSTTFMFSS